MDQRLAWQRPDVAFFAAGACHVLAWTCRAVHADRDVGITALRFADDGRVWHTYATWQDWAFDASGWNPEADLIAANERFEHRKLATVSVSHDLGEFCRVHQHRMPQDYWSDPMPRARAYVARHTPPWARRAG